MNGDPNKPPREGVIRGGCARDVDIKANYPFLRVKGGDVVSGADLGQAGGGANAGIDTNGTSNNGSSSGQYGVFASGLLSTASPADFFGNNLNERESRKDLVFANTGVDSNGYGQFYGQGAGPSTNYDVGMFRSKANVKEVSSSDASSYSLNVADQNKTVIIDGDLTIGGSGFSYSGGNVDSIAELPNMTVVVLGNIYIEGSVTEVDGTFIALPIDANNGGVIDTCSDADGNKGRYPDSGSTLTVDVCNNTLTFKGRLIARDVIWKRTRGSIGSSSSTIRSDCLFSSANLNTCAAEFINMTPADYFGGFDNNPSSTVGNVPISSIELPPIY
jgi:hypothetical protein